MGVEMDGSAAVRIMDSLWCGNPYYSSFSSSALGRYYVDESGASQGRQRTKFNTEGQVDKTKKSERGGIREGAFRSRIW